MSDDPKNEPVAEPAPAAEPAARMEHGEEYAERMGAIESRMDAIESGIGELRGMMQRMAPADDAPDAPPAAEPAEPAARSLAETAAELEAVRIRGEVETMVREGKILARDVETVHARMAAGEPVDEFVGDYTIAALRQGTGAAAVDTAGAAPQAPTVVTRSQIVAEETAKGGAPAEILKRAQVRIAEADAAGVLNWEAN